MSPSRCSAALAALLAVLLSAPVAHAGQIVTFSYDFTGAGINPGPFGPSSVSPIPAVPITNPTISASTPDDGSGFTEAVIQSPVGLGVFSDPPGILNSEFLSPHALVVDGQGTGGGGNTLPESLDLTLSSTDPLVIDGVLVGLTLGAVNDIGGSPDLEIFLNNVSQGTFDLPSAGPLSVGTLLLNIPFNDGDVLTLAPLAPVGTNSNAFSVIGAQVQATIAPEPTSVAIWSIAALGLAGYGRRRRRRSRAAA